MRVVQKLQQHKTPIAKKKGDVAFGSKLFNVYYTEHLTFLFCVCTVHPASDRSSRPNAAVPISKMNRPSQVAK